MADNAAKEATARLAALEKERQRLADELAAAQLAATSSAAGDKNTLADELAAARRRIADLEKQFDECEARVANPRSHLDQSKGSLAKAEKDLLKALRPEISKGTVSVSQTGDALTINLTSRLLFDSG